MLALKKSSEETFSYICYSSLVIPSIRFHSIEDNCRHMVSTGFAHTERGNWYPILFTKTFSIFFKINKITIFFLHTFYTDVTWWWYYLLLKTTILYSLKSCIFYTTQCIHVIAGQHLENDLGYSQNLICSCIKIFSIVRTQCRQILCSEM